MTFVSALYDTFLDLFFPFECVVCKASGSVLCQKCLSEIPFSKRAFLAEHTHIQYLYDFRNPIVHQLLWQAKYHHNLNVLKILGNVLGKELEKDFDKNKTFLIPIPLSNKDSRLHNHAHVLAEATGFKIFDILEKNTEHKQARLEHKNERQENIKGKIIVNENKLKKFMKLHSLEPQGVHKYTFVLLDDVVTTGSTLLEAKKVLECSGFKIHSLYTLAH